MKKRWEPRPRISIEDIAAAESRYTKPTPTGGIGDEDKQKLDHLWAHHIAEHEGRGEVTD